MDYGRAVRIVRAARGVSQKELAGQVGIASVYVSMIENGRREPSRALLERFAAAMGVSFPLLVILATENPTTLPKAQQDAFGAEFLNLLTHGVSHAHDRDP